MRIKNQSINKGKNGSATDNYSEVARALMLPQEVNELPYHEELIFVQGTKKTPPIKIRARKIFWYEEDVFNERAHMTPPTIPLGDAAKIDDLTVSVRTVEAKVAVAAPHDQQLRNEQEKRNNPPA